jgi:hypothetical protein
MDADLHGLFLLGCETIRIGMQLRGRAIGGRLGPVWIQNGLARTADWSLDPARARRYPINRSEKSVPDPNQILLVGTLLHHGVKAPLDWFSYSKNDP